MQAPDLCIAAQLVLRHLRLEVPTTGRWRPDFDHQRQRLLVDLESGRMRCHLAPRLVERPHRHVRAVARGAGDPHLDVLPRLQARAVELGLSAQLTQAEAARLAAASDALYAPTTCYQAPDDRFGLTRA